MAAEPSPGGSLLETRQERVVLQQWDLSCGAAALATILKYQFDEPVTERVIALELIKRDEYIADPSLVSKRQGFSLLDLQRVVERRHFKGVGLGRLAFEDLLEHAPLIVPMSFNGYHHFVVFRGAYRGQVILADPGWGNRTLSADDFERAWTDYPKIGKIGFFVAARDGKPRPNRLAPRAKDFLIAPTNFPEQDQLRVPHKDRPAPILLTGSAEDVPLGLPSARGTDTSQHVDPGKVGQTLPAGLFEPHNTADVTVFAGNTVPVWGTTTVGGTTANVPTYAAGTDSPSTVLTIAEVPLTTLDSAITVVTTPLQGILSSNDVTADITTVLESPLITNTVTSVTAPLMDTTASVAASLPELTTSVSASIATTPLLPQVADSVSTTLSDAASLDASTPLPVIATPLTGGTPQLGASLPLTLSSGVSPLFGHR
ncbi:MAG: hypothetical protein HZB57_00885 [Gammaproteobacteria bacterium]|nr:hypothetical protein [Gammaproteobacteria bacterium]